VSFKNLQSINYNGSIKPHGLIKIGTATKLKKLRFKRFMSELSDLNADIKLLHPIAATLRQLTILPDMQYARYYGNWKEVNFSCFTALEILRVPSVLLFDEPSCRELLMFTHRAGFERRSDVTHLLPPNLLTLELWFKYPSGIFAAGGPFMRQFQELSGLERVRYFDWMVALLQLGSLRRVRMSEHFVWAERPDRQVNCTYEPPDVVSGAFCNAGVELEIEVLGDGLWYYES
jgi:hypothetical protein